LRVSEPESLGLSEQHRGDEEPVASQTPFDQCIREDAALCSASGSRARCTGHDGQSLTIAGARILSRTFFRGNPFHKRPKGFRLRWCEMESRTSVTRRHGQSLEQSDDHISDRSLLMPPTCQDHGGHMRTVRATGCLAQPNRALFASCRTTDRRTKEAEAPLLRHATGPRLFRARQAAIVHSRQNISTGSVSTGSQSTRRLREMGAG